jgi:hypothetical protein
MTATQSCLLLLLILAPFYVSTRNLNAPSEESLKEVSAEASDSADLVEETLATFSSRSKSLESLPLTLLFDLTINLLTYASIFLPGYLLKRRYFARGGPSYDGRGKEKTDALE